MDTPRTMFVLTCALVALAGTSGAIGDSSGGQPETAICGLTEARAQYHSSKSFAPEPPAASEPFEPILQPDFLRRIVEEYCTYTINATRQRFMEWVTNCSNRAELEEKMRNTGGLCGDDNLPAPWMRDYILPYVGPISIPKCLRISNIGGECRDQLNIDGREDSTQQMDDVIACLVENKGSLGEECDDMAVLTGEMLILTFYAGFGVHPSEQALQSLEGVHNA